MQNSLRRAGYLLTALIIAGGPTDVAATPLSSFRYEAQAQRHCPHDAVVWLDFKKEIYYFKKQRRYGQGSTGSFVCQGEARSSGFRRSMLGLR
jgi:hypothetical protein